MTDLSNLRAGIIAASEQALRGGGRKRRNNKNPLYRPNPQSDAATKAVGSCRRLLEVSEHSPEYILGGLHDGGYRQRGVDAIAKAHAFLGRLLAASK